jgi:hypothetical protein
MAFRLQKKVFERAFKGKTNVPYKLRVAGHQYKLALQLVWKYEFFKGFMKSMAQQAGKKIPMSDEFEASENSYNFLLNNIEPTLEKIDKIERQKLNGFKRVSANVEHAKFNKVGDNMHLDIVVGGVCEYRV